MYIYKIYIYKMNIYKLALEKLLLRSFSYLLHETNTSFFSEIYAQCETIVNKPLKN